MSLPVSRSVPAARASRAPLPIPAGFEALDQTHVEIFRMLQRLDELLQRLDRQGPTIAIRANAKDIARFFDSHGREHHRDEERLVFPALLASGDPALIAHVRRLQQDHGWLEEDWSLLAPQLHAIARGENRFDMDLLRHTLPNFAALYEEHIALEESLVYPASRQQQQMQVQNRTP